jgi:hypothetical protein
MLSTIPLFPLIYHFIPFLEVDVAAVWFMSTWSLYKLPNLYGL